MKKWKDPLLLLSGIGISSIGGWIYLIALNLIVLDEWGSPLAVVMLYVLKPLAALITNGWAGSLIDRVNKRNLMAALDFFRAVLIAALPFLSAELVDVCRRAFHQYGECRSFILHRWRISRP